MGEAGEPDDEIPQLARAGISGIVVRKRRSLRRRSTCSQRGLLRASRACQQRSAMRKLQIWRKYCRPT
jgi:hypothetical protein